VLKNRAISEILGLLRLQAVRKTWISRGFESAALFRASPGIVFSHHPDDPVLPAFPGFFGRSAVA
jgi:hypothetical protein